MKKRGFTLIELMMAIVIIAISFYALISVFATIAPRDINARTLTVGTHLINEKMAETLMKSFTAVASAPATSFPPPFNRYYSQITVNYVATAEPNVVTASPTKLKKVTVKVWGPGLLTIEGVNIAATYEGKINY